MKYFLLPALFLAVTVAAQTSDFHNDCPMHDEHASQASAATDHHHTDELNRRGEQGMGFDQLKTTHHFLLAKDGGAIDVRANSGEDKTSIDQIQGHLRHIVKAFAAGDFAIPMLVHDQMPPGVPEMKRLKDRIQYRYESTDSGARIVISTADSAALQAVWDFLRFQIADHKTGDPVAAPR